MSGHPLRRCGIGLAASALLWMPDAWASNCADRLDWRARAAASTRALRAEDLIELRDFGPGDSLIRRKDLFSLSPDRRQIAIQLRRAEVARNDHCQGVVVVDAATGAARLVDIGGEPILWLVDFRGQAELASGAIDARAPLWSPDGQWLAYLRRDGGRTRLWRVRAAGGTAQPVATGEDDVRRFAWSARSEGWVYEIRPRLVAARAAIAEEGRSGYLYDLRFAPMHGNAPSAPPDTPTELRFVALDGRGDRPATESERRLLAPPLPPGTPPNAGSWVAGEGGALAWTAPRDPQVYVGTLPLTLRIGGKTIACGVAACADRIAGMWWIGLRDLVFVRDWGSDGLGAVELFRWTPGRPPVSLLRTTDALIDCQLGEGALYCARETARRPRHLVRIALGSGTVQTLFDPNPQFTSATLGAVQRLAARAADGAPAFADLVLPPGHRPGQRHPLIVVQYQSRGFLRGGVGDEYPIHLFAAHGYAVLSFQRPMAFAEGHKARDLNAFQRINIAGFADRRRVFTALEAAVDAAIATGTVDPARLGITGLSEGASSAIWAILSTPRYRAAAISSCCEDPYPSFYGNGLAFARDMKAWGYPLPADDRDGFWQTFSLAQGARRVATPLLLQMADQEYRYALQGVGALLEQGKPVELYVFPGEFHNKWQPEHRAAIYARGLDWFDFWLRARIDPAPAKAPQYQRWRAMRSGGALPRD